MTDAFPYKATLKSGAGYDAPWLTVDGANVEDLRANLGALLDNDVVETLISVANLLKAANNAAPLVDNAPQAAPAAAAPQQPAQQKSWGQPQQQAAPQQGGQRQYGGVQHPAGEACEACGTVLEAKKTSNGKDTWTCPSWRWNGGAQNEHTRVWV